MSELTASMFRSEIQIDISECAMSPPSSLDSGLGSELRYSPSSLSANSYLAPPSTLNPNSLSVKVGRSLTFTPDSKNGHSGTESSIVLPLHLKFKEKSVSNLGPPIQKEASIVPNRAVVIFSFLSIVVVLTIGGGYMFLLVEAEAPTTVPVAFSDCFEVAQELATLNKFTTQEVVDELRKCVLSKTSVENVGQGFLYAWSLYTTVGYGDRYPHTGVGQALTLLFGWLSAPLFMAFKIEMGEIISLVILYFGRGIFSLVQKFIKLVFKQHVDTGEPSDLLLSSLLTLFFAFVLCFTATLIDEIGWWSALYTTGATVMLIGLGDFVPGTNWKIFIILVPLYLFGDVLCSYLFYYMHGILRIKVHTFADFVTRKKTANKIQPESFYLDLPTEESHQNMEKKRTSVFPSVTTTSMPFTSEFEAEFFEVVVVQGRFSKQVEEVDFDTDTTSREEPKY